MKKLLLIAFPVVLIVISVLIMNSGSYLKQPAGDKDDFIKYMTQTQKDIQGEDWDNALKNLETARNAYRIVVRRIQYSVERDEINQIEDNLARIKGYLITKDIPGAMAEIMESLAHWDELEK